MKETVRLAIVFGIAQTALSVLIWGNIEYSILIGDSIRGAEVSFMKYLFDGPLFFYLGSSVLNSAFFVFLVYKYRDFFPQNISGAVLFAVGTVAIGVPITIFASSLVPYLLAPTVSFLIVAVFCAGATEVRKRFRLRST